MTRTILLSGAALLLLSACNARDEGNGSTVLSVDENAIEQGVDQAGNALGAAANEVEQAAENAGPVLENAAESTGNAAAKAGNRIEGAVENTDVDVDVSTGNDQNR